MRGGAPECAAGVLSECSEFFLVLIEFISKVQFFSLIFSEESVQGKDVTLVFRMFRLPVLLFFSEESYTGIS